MKFWKLFLVVIVIVVVLMVSLVQVEDKWIVFVVKVFGIGFFEVVVKGVEEVVKEFGDVEIIYIGLIDIMVEGQIEVINVLIVQKVDVIVIFVND